MCICQKLNPRQDGSGPKLGRQSTLKSVRKSRQPKSPISTPSLQYCGVARLGCSPLGQSLLRHSPRDGIGRVWMRLESKLKRSPPPQATTTTFTVSNRGQWPGLLVALGANASARPRLEELGAGSETSERCWCWCSAFESYSCKCQALDVCGASEGSGSAANISSK